jgi:hypothetical protein
MALHYNWLYRPYHIPTAIFSQPHLKELLYFMHVYGNHQPFSSLSSPLFIFPPPTTTSVPCTYFTVLSSIFDSNVNVQMGQDLYLANIVSNVN